VVTGYEVRKGGNRVLDLVKGWFALVNRGGGCLECTPC